jgi:hypothetical protein
MRCEVFKFLPTVCLSLCQSTALGHLFLPVIDEAKPLAAEEAVAAGTRAALPVVAVDDDADANVDDDAAADTEADDGAVDGRAGVCLLPALDGVPCAAAAAAVVVVVACADMGRATGTWCLGAANRGMVRAVVKEEDGERSMEGNGGGGGGGGGEIM